MEIDLLKAKTVLITGATDGLGKLVSRRAAAGTHAQAYDADARKKLWHISEELVKNYLLK